MRAFSFLAGASIPCLVVVAALATPPLDAPDSPDSRLTPGAINPDVTQDNISTTICVVGWTKTIRPEASYTSHLKRTQMKAWKLPGTMKDYEEDHLISLEIGGNPTDQRNLWPQPYDPKSGMGAHQKDDLENELHRLVCNGALSLNAAQTAISTDWKAAYAKYVGQQP